MSQILTPGRRGAAAQHQTVNVMVVVSTSNQRIDLFSFPCFE